MQSKVQYPYLLNETFFRNHFGKRVSKCSDLVHEERLNKQLHMIRKIHRIQSWKIKSSKKPCTLLCLNLQLWIFVFSDWKRYSCCTKLWIVFNFWKSKNFLILKADPTNPIQSRRMKKLFKNSWIVLLAKFGYILNRIYRC